MAWVILFILEFHWWVTMSWSTFNLSFEGPQQGNDCWVWELCVKLEFLRGPIVQKILPPFGNALNHSLATPSALDAVHPRVESLQSKCETKQLDELLARFFYLGILNFEAWEVVDNLQSNIGIMKAFVIAQVGNHYFPAWLVDYHEAKSIDLLSGNRRHVYSQTILQLGSQLRVTWFEDFADVYQGSPTGIVRAQNLPQLLHSKFKRTLPCDHCQHENAISHLRVCCSCCCGTQIILDAILRLGKSEPFFGWDFKSVIRLRSSLDGQWQRRFFSCCCQLLCRMKTLLLLDDRCMFDRTLFLGGCCLVVDIA